ncbi:Reverse transcriptase domain [Arabidopsis thaliana x Arabidopsis arenosa]|uniref:Reverse transcriptase domain n=1 Tax=Arabidopsis thaliana x Arabidopsis arenosa TaxID=1240361 RepID=A0A8T2A7B9_9BRAS|nr:Reverse transcriptase domain [Arabidopsis thaliana x Arabidopsis arenosa]
MGKTSKKKKKPQGWISPSGSASPPSSASISSDSNQQSSLVSPVSKFQPPNASALVPETGSAIVDSQSVGSPDLGEKPLMTLGSKVSTVPAQSASVIVSTTSSATVENLIPTVTDLGTPVLGQVSGELLVQTPTVSAPSQIPLVEIASVPTPSKPPAIAVANAADASSLPPSPVVGGDSWVNLFKGSAKSLSKKGESFILPSGEACVKIPNAIIEKNLKSWESFIIGQFYADPPPQALIHTIVNGIWSRHFKDISVSKLEGNAFLFRIPNAQTRRRVLNQMLWQVEGQTMFVANWEPGMVPVKPELSSAPIWLELRNVPLQFFNDDGFERIAGLVGDPKFLHPDTANKTNLEVAKVFTVIDPRKPLPEAVNVQFDSGDIARVGVSSPWMPPICSHCKEVGHTLKRCRTAPVTCKGCKSTSHSISTCPRVQGNGVRKPVRAKGTATGSLYKEKKLPLVVQENVLNNQPIARDKVYVVKPNSKSPLIPPSSLLLGSVPLVGDSSKSAGKRILVDVSDGEKEKISDADPDSSDTLSSEAAEDFDEDYVSEEEHEYLEPKIAKFVNALLPGWLFDDNYAFSDLGKIWILWHPTVKVTVLTKSLQMITCEVEFPGNPSAFIISFVYASNDDFARSLLWRELIDTAESSSVVGKAWAVLGDFNQILSPAEHSTRSNQNVDRAMREFSDSLLNASLSDLNFRGCSFTWWNKRRLNPVAKKLDRILVNDDWQVLFPFSSGFFGAPEFSDHSPCTITLDHAQPRQKKPFKFFNYLLKNPDFLPLVCLSWFSFNFVGSEMFRVSSKLKELKLVIREFSKLNYSDLEKRVKEAMEVLSVAQTTMLSNPSVANAALELDASRKWELLSQAEESFFCQRSRITWLDEGDKNSAYFHRMASVRQSINHIHYLEDAAGNRFDTQVSIHEHCVDFFKDLLGSVETPPLFIQEDISSILDFNCSAEQKVSFEALFTTEEIKAAFFSLPRNKTSGPDGYSAEFFTSCWSVIGGEVSAAVAEFFRSGTLLKQWNATTLVLIPKIQNASRVSDFRPISCLNTMYKVISKLLANRLKSILPLVISHSQSAFLPGRLLSENVLLASEIVQGYNRSNISPRGMLKVDIRKAFDSVRWDFVLSILHALGIPVRFIGWIKECICSPSFSIQVNGISAGFFKSTRGLRQGDPLSPYLFLLAMEVFSRLVLSRFESGYISYHPKTSDLKISHLMFADDVMVFFDGSSSSLHGIYETLDDFATWSGLRINREKTLLFHSGLSLQESSSIAAYGFPIGSLPVRYLGLPLMSRKLRINEYSPLLAKISSKFRAWAVKSLSFAGRTQLISSVIYGIVNFWISTFMLPKGCIRMIESICARFLWSGNIDTTGKSKVSWKTVCLPKSEGGLGLRKFSVWNTTLCLRLIWLLFSNSGSLWVAWHHHHHKLALVSFWAVKLKGNDSWFWKSLLKLRGLAQKFIHCIIGNGSQTWFWHDNWTKLGPLICFLGEDGPRNLRIPLHAKVSEAYNSHGWIIASPRSDQALALHVFLSSLDLSTLALAEDSFVWVVEDKPSQNFSASKTWEAIRPRDSTKEWAKLVWFKGSTPKHAFNMWIANLDRLPTMSRLASWGLQVSPLCCLCSTAVETRDHLFLHCPFAQVIWDLIMPRLRQPLRVFSRWSSLLDWAKENNQLSPSTLRLLIVHALVYSVWRQRNNLIHNQVVVPPLTIFRDIDRQIINSINARRYLKRFRNLMLCWL